MGWWICLHRCVDVCMHLVLVQVVAQWRLQSCSTLNSYQFCLSGHALPVKPPDCPAPPAPPATCLLPAYSTHMASPVCGYLEHLQASKEAKKRQASSDLLPLPSAVRLPAATQPGVALCVDDSSNIRQRRSFF